MGLFNPNNNNLFQPMPGQNQNPTVDSFDQGALTPTETPPMTQNNWQGIVPRTDPFGGMDPFANVNAVKKLQEEQAAKAAQGPGGLGLAATPGGTMNFGGKSYSAKDGKWVENGAAGGAGGGGGAGTPNTQGSPGVPGGTNPFMNFTGANPWAQNVTAGTVDSSGAANGNVNFATPTNPNINYLTKDAASDTAKRWGLNLVSQNMGGQWGPAGAPSAPMYGGSAGEGDPLNLGQIKFWEQRGDSNADIAARLRAGVAPPLGVGTPNETSWNLAKPLETNLAAGKTSSYGGFTPSTHLGPQGGGKPTPMTPGSGGGLPGGGGGQTGGGLLGGGPFTGGYPGGNGDTTFNHNWGGGGGTGGYGGGGYGGGGYGGGGGFNPFQGNMSGFASRMNTLNPYANANYYFGGGGQNTNMSSVPQQRQTVDPRLWNSFMSGRGYGASRPGYSSY